MASVLIYPLNRIDSQFHAILSTKTLKTLKILILNDQNFTNGTLYDVLLQLAEYSILYYGICQPRPIDSTLHLKDV